jgi:NAD-dependent DNA ligase
MSTAKILNDLITNPSKTLAKISKKEIVDILTAASDAYYNSDTSIMSDDLYDMVKDHLERIDPKNPFLKVVGAPIQGEKVKLPYYMGSMNKIRDDEKTIEKWVQSYPGSVVISDKLDGISALLVATPTSRTLYTRGDGTYGQNISNMMPYLNLPELPASAFNNVKNKILAIRGELIISRAHWEEIKHLGANARNVVAGCINKSQKNTPDEEIARRIDFVVYELVNPKLAPSDGLAFLREYGFKVVFNILKTEIITMEMLSSILIERRAHSPYECDGIVIYQDTQHELVRGKNPANAFAYKSIHTHEQVEVVVSEVEWNVSKDGYMKPLVKFMPVVLAGVTISKATGFNAAFIESHRLGPGSRIIIIRSGDVIPHILKVLTPSASNLPSMPSVAYVWNKTHVDIMIETSSADEPNIDMNKSMLAHFVKSLDMKGVGPGIVNKMVDAGINTIPKLMNVTVDKLMHIEGFQKKSAEKVASTIANCKNTVECVDLMAASNIFGRGFGSRKLKTIIKAYPHILKRQAPSMSELLQIEGIGPETAPLFIKNLPKFFKLLDEIGIPCRGDEPEAPPTPKPQESKSASSKEKEKPKEKESKIDFKNQTVVFTGVRSKDLEKIIEAAGGKVTTSISKNTTLVITKDINENNAKLNKARELKIKIISINSV